MRWALLAAVAGLAACVNQPVLPSQPSATAPVERPAVSAPQVPAEASARPAAQPSVQPDETGLVLAPESAAVMPHSLPPEEAAFAEQGIASWYGPRFHGRRTANGERFNQHALTAAHKTLPFGTRVRVTSLLNGREVIVRINDRGPFIKGRIIDLSDAAARAIGLQGIKPVKLSVVHDAAVQHGLR